MWLAPVPAWSWVEKSIGAPISSEIAWAISAHLFLYIAYNASKYSSLSSFLENAHVSKAFFAAATASLTSSIPPKDITAHSSSVDGSITL